MVYISRGIIIQVNVTLKNIFQKYLCSVSLFSKSILDMQDTDTFKVVP